MLLEGKAPGGSVKIALPDGADARFDLHETRVEKDSASATVIKDAGDDPDVTNGARITVTAAWNDTGKIALLAGEGIGTVTLPGLQVPPGEPAINPAPRRMIESCVREVTKRGVTLVISVPGGKELAGKTFNGKLGIVGGISILGTTGRVKPYSCEAIRETLKCSVNVAAAVGIKCPALAPGNIGEKAARVMFSLEAHQVIRAGNDWGVILDAVAGHAFQSALIIGHPGKLAKLAVGHWDTHSSRSPSAAGFVAGIAAELLKRDFAVPNTAEGFFAGLENEDRTTIADDISRRIRLMTAERMRWEQERIAVVLVDMNGAKLGHAGDLSPWAGRHCSRST